MMVNAMITYGADSFVGKVVSTVQGATTFYVLAGYFGSIGIKNTRYAVVCVLITDFVGIIAAILMAYLFYH
jgi:spore maturation protein SpmB